VLHPHSLILARSSSAVGFRMTGHR